MEAGLFCPSGTMTNQLAIKTHTQAGDEVICDELSHIYQYEGGGIAFNSGCSVKLLHGDRGRVMAEQVLSGINAEDVHKPITRLVSLENTTNRGGGACYDFNEFKNIKKVTEQHGLALHLDGARLFNALVHKQEAAIEYGNIFDSISICLSKGLGAPVGSVLIGSHSFITKARRWRKVFGGGMRQAGYLAAAGIYAMDHHVDRLADDHKNAKILSEGNEAIIKQSNKALAFINTKNTELSSIRDRIVELRRQIQLIYDEIVASRDVDEIISKEELIRKLLLNIKHDSELIRYNIRIINEKYVIVIKRDLIETYSWEEEEYAFEGGYYNKSMKYYNKLSYIILQ
jgi:threonine aldolase